MNKYRKEPTIAEIEANPWSYQIWMLLELDEASRWLKTEIDRLRHKRKRLAKNHGKV